MLTAQLPHRDAQLLHSEMHCSLCARYASCDNQLIGRTSSLHLAVSGSDLHLLRALKWAHAATAGRSAVSGRYFTAIKTHECRTMVLKLSCSTGALAAAVACRCRCQGAVWNRPSCCQQVSLLGVACVCCHCIAQLCHKELMRNGNYQCPPAIVVLLLVCMPAGHSALFFCCCWFLHCSSLQVH